MPVLCLLFVKNSNVTTGGGSCIAQEEGGVEGSILISTSIFGLCMYQSGSHTTCTSTLQTQNDGNKLCDQCVQAALDRLWDLGMDRWRGVPKGDTTDALWSPPPQKKNSEHHAPHWVQVGWILGTLPVHRAGVGGRTKRCESYEHYCAQVTPLRRYSVFIIASAFRSIMHLLWLCSTPGDAWWGVSLLTKPFYLFFLGLGAIQVACLTHLMDHTCGAPQSLRLGQVILRQLETTISACHSYSATIKHSAYTVLKPAMNKCRRVQLISI